MKNYVNCLLEKGKCTPDGAELKGKLCPVNLRLSIIEIIINFKKH